MLEDLKKKVYQMFILGTEGGGYEAALSCGLGGVIFFTKDIQSQKQFVELIKKIKNISAIPPFLSIDQEGGRVERTENIYNGKKYLSAKYAFESGLEFLKQQTFQMAKELSGYGINLNFAPCIDVNTNPDNPIIGERAFSSNVEDVILAEKIVSNEYRRNGIIPCVKHFPGHGDADADSHLTLPKIDLPLEVMEKIHIKPFKSAIENGAEMIMVAHLHCTCFEYEEIPTSLSSAAISYLTDRLGFDGVVISDDMIMKGVSKFGQLEACVRAIKSGMNMFIYRSCEPEIVDVIEGVYKLAKTDELLRSKIELSYKKIFALKKKYLCN